MNVMYLIFQGYGPLRCGAVKVVTVARFGRNCCLLHHCRKCKNPVSNFSFEYLNVQETNLYMKVQIKLPHFMAYLGNF
jgi:hypothetical protein